MTGALAESPGPGAPAGVLQSASDDRAQRTPDVVIDRRTGSSLVMLLLTIGAAGLSARARADTVHLKNGRKITAGSVRIDGDRLVLETPAGTITIPRTEVASIEKTPAAADAPLKTRTSPSGERLVLESPPLANDPRDTKTDWIAMGAAALTARQFDRAQSCYLAALAADPRSTPAGIGAATAMLGAGDAAGAAGRARAVVAGDPASAPGWLILGEAEYAMGDLAEARRALERSRSLSSSPELIDWIARVGAEEKASSGYGSLWSGHFRIQFDASLSPRRAHESLAFLDSIYEEMARLFRHHPSEGLTVVLYPRDSFHELTGLGDEVVGLYDGKIRVPTGGPDQLREDDRMTLRHELAHAFIDSKTAGHCPHWLHEGLAQRAEPRSSRGMESLLAANAADEAALEGRYTYGSALSFVDYLEARFGEDRMNTLLEKLAAEPRIDEAFLWAFGAPYADLVAGWGKTLRQRRS